MSLISTMEVLLKRPLVNEEVANLADFQRLYSIGDDDPLIVVLAMMARSQIMVSTLPDLLQQKATETIELHRLVLREQSTLIAKELITTLAQNIESANVDWKVRWLRYVACFVCGAIAAAIVFIALRMLGR